MNNEYYIAQKVAKLNDIWCTPDNHTDLDIPAFIRAFNEILPL